MRTYCPVCIKPQRKPRRCRLIALKYHFSFKLFSDRKSYWWLQIFLTVQYFCFNILLENTFWSLYAWYLANPPMKTPILTKLLTSPLYNRQCLNVSNDAYFLHLDLTYVLIFRLMQVWQFERSFNIFNYFKLRLLPFSISFKWALNEEIIVKKPFSFHDFVDASRLSD